MRHITIAAIAIVAGCSRSPQWVKPDGTEQQLMSDSYTCERDKRQSYFGKGIPASFAADDFYKRCMLSKGWSPPK